MLVGISHTFVFTIAIYKCSTFATLKMLSCNTKRKIERNNLDMNFWAVETANDFDTRSEIDTKKKERDTSKSLDTLSRSANTSIFAVSLSVVAFSNLERTQRSDIFIVLNGVSGITFLVLSCLRFCRYEWWFHIRNDHSVSVLQRILSTQSWTLFIFLVLSIAEFGILFSLYS